MESGRKPRSLLDMCVQKLIDNLRYVGRVDGVEMELLKRILPHCTLEQLTRIENRTEMDLSPVTDSLWKRFYQREFGEEHTNMVIKRM
jgi:elongin-A